MLNLKLLPPSLFVEEWWIVKKKFIFSLEVAGKMNLKSGLRKSLGLKVFLEVVGLNLHQVCLKIYLLGHRVYHMMF